MNKSFVPSPGPVVNPAGQSSAEFPIEEIIDDQRDYAELTAAGRGRGGTPMSQCRICGEEIVPWIGPMRTVAVVGWVCPHCGILMHPECSKVEHDCKAEIAAQYGDGFKV